MNFILDNLVNKEHIANIVNNNKGKKIICFGAGTATYLMPRILPDGYSVEYYLDSNSRIWGIGEQGVEIRNPKSILDEVKGNFIIFIVSQHALSMRKQLDSYGLKMDEDYYDIYTICEMFFRMQKVIFQAEHLIEMVDRLPGDAFQSKVDNRKDKIGVVAACGYMGTPMIYDIGIFLLLKYNGYDAELIMDNTYTCENFTMYEGASRDIKEIIDRVLEHIRNKFPELIVHSISESMSSDLSEQDIKKVKQHAQMNVIWQKSRQNERSMTIEEDTLYQKFVHVFEYNLKNIKAFFEEHTYSVLTVSTGLHYHRGLYMYVGKQKGIRVANYDGANNDGKTSWSTDLPNGHHYDIPKLILGDFFNKEEKNWIINKAKSHFEIRRYSISDGKTLYNYQLVEDGIRNEQKWYDVIIPLNVMWDAAAIGQNLAFETETKWLIDTIHFILDSTKASIMVREHPVQIQLQKYNNASFQDLLEKEFGKNNERLKFVPYYEKLNTYTYLEHAKVILPLSSTVGLESVFLYKPIITHSNCYYSKLNFARAAKTPEEYFGYIRMALEGKIIITETEREEAFMAYYILMNSRITTQFSESNQEWLFKNLDELNNDPSVHAILDAITHDIPVPYYNLHLSYLQEKDKD